MVAGKDGSDQGKRPNGWNERGFAQIPRWLLHDPAISAHAKLVFVALSSHVNRQGLARVKASTLALVCSLSIPAVRRAIRELEALGVLQRQARIVAGGQRANAYLLTSAPVDEPVDESED